MAIIINSAWDAQQFYKEKEEARKHINSAWDAQQYYQTYGGNGHAGNWGSREWSAQKYGNAYVYNPAQRSWSLTALPSFNTTSFKSSKISAGKGISFKGGSSGAISQAGATNSSKDASTSSKTAAEKEYIDIEFNTLTGDIELIPTKNNLKIKVNNTVNLKGVGKYLSGLYFVSEIKHRIDKDGGYSMTMTLFKNGFGESLKSSAVLDSGATSPANDGRADVVDTTENVVTSKIKVGDKVKIVGDNATYANAYDGVKVPNWVKQQVLTVDAISSDGNRARVNPIWSWTYVKYLKLV